MSQILEKIESSFWIKVVAAAVFIVMLYAQNAREISQVRAEAVKDDIKNKDEIQNRLDDNYVRKEMFGIILDELKDIKVLLRSKK